MATVKSVTSGYVHSVRGLPSPVAVSFSFATPVFMVSKRIGGTLDQWHSDSVCLWRPAVIACSSAVGVGASLALFRHPRWCLSRVKATYDLVPSGVACRRTAAVVVYVVRMWDCLFILGMDEWRSAQKTAGFSRCIDVYGNYSIFVCKR